jgi:hypothetical protein
VRVPAATSSEQSRLRLSQSPLWTDLLDRVETQISGPARIRGSGPASLQGTASALARAHSRLLVALESRSTVGQDVVSQLASEAVELLLAVARVWTTFGARVEDRRGAMVDLLRRRLSSHEDAVLAGEITYSVWREQAEAPAVRMRQAIARLSRNAATSEGDLLALKIASVDFASLLVQLAANAAASGHAGGAPEEPSAELAAKVSSVIAELTSHAHEVERPVSDRADVVAHHLAAGLRVRVPQGTLQRLGASSPGRIADWTLLDRLRDPWLRLATNEYTAVAALDAQLATPTYNERSEHLASAIADAAANVICGARLAGRPAAFRHRQAWRHQAVALTYALEAYAAGLQGHAPSLAQAERITLTRLVRATVAIALIDLGRDHVGADR